MSDVTPGSLVPAGLLGRIRARFDKVPEPGRLVLVVLRRTPGTPNFFDDVALLAEVETIDGGPDRLRVHRADWVTCDPGTVWYDEPMNPEGTAFLQEQYAEGAYKVGWHRRGTRTQRRAFRQIRPLTFRRLRPDGSWTEVKSGIIAANVHGPPPGVEGLKRVGRNSAACIVYPSHSTMMDVIALYESKNQMVLDLVLLEGVIS